MSQYPEYEINYSFHIFSLGFVHHDTFIEFLDVFIFRISLYFSCRLRSIYSSAWTKQNTQVSLDLFLGIVFAAFKFIFFIIIVFLIIMVMQIHYSYCHLTPTSFLPRYCPVTAPLLPRFCRCIASLHTLFCFCMGQVTIGI